MFGQDERYLPERAAGGHWKQHLVHSVGGPENVAPLAFVVVGLGAVALLFGLDRDIRNAKELETVVVIATTVLLAGLIQVLTAVVRWWSISGERNDFHEFFGRAPMLGVLPDLAAPEIAIEWHPPGSAGAHPKGTKIVPFQDLKAAIWIAELFEDFDTTFTIMADTPFVNGTPPERGFVAIGLGFNRLTCMLAAMSRLFEIRYVDTYSGSPKDDFTLGAHEHGEPTPSRDYALIARVPVTMNGKVAPAFVCAGRTAEGTAAAGYFLKNSWRKLYALYGQQQRFCHDALAVELVYTPGAFIQSEVSRHVFGPVDRVALPTIAADDDRVATVESVRGEVVEPAAAAPVALPSTNGVS